MGRWACAGVPGLLVSLLACEDDASTTPSALNRYVEALASEDFDAAMAERCAPGRIDESKRDQFMAEVRRLHDAFGGSIEVAEAVPVEPVEVGSLLGSASHRQFEVTFQQLSSDSISTPIAVVTVLEDGQERLCGFRTAESLRSPLSAPPPITPMPDGQLDDVRRLSRVAGPAGGAVASEGPVDLSSWPEAIDGWSVAWQFPEFGGARVTAVRLVDSGAAIDAALERARLRAIDGVELFDVPALSGAAGVRYVASAWTWLQPSSVGPLSDAVIGVVDDTVLVVEVSALDPDDDHSTALNLVDQLRNQVD